MFYQLLLVITAAIISGLSVDTDVDCAISESAISTPVKVIDLAADTVVGI